MYLSRLLRGREVDRARLRSVLRDRAPWLAATDVGPAAVAAGDCDRCGDAPRLLPLCGPVVWEAVCRDCGLELGDDGWCDGHLADGADARAWASELPEDWPLTVLLWWLATGELRSVELSSPDRAALPPAIEGALGG